jgi:hypothetical protein
VQLANVSEVVIVTAGWPTPSRWLETVPKQVVRVRLVPLRALADDQRRRLQPGAIELDQLNIIVTTPATNPRFSRDDLRSRWQGQLGFNFRF